MKIIRFVCSTNSVKIVIAVNDYPLNSSRRDEAIFKYI